MATLVVLSPRAKMHRVRLPLTLLGPQSRFGDKLLIIRVLCPHIWECGAKGVKEGKKTPAVRLKNTPQNSYFHTHHGVCSKLQRVKQNQREPALFEREALSRAGGFRKPLVYGYNPRGAVRTEVAPERVLALMSIHLFYLCSPSSLSTTPATACYVLLQLELWVGNSQYLVYGYQ